MNRFESEFDVPGINPVDLEYLKQVGNYRYYKRKLRNLLEGRCEFCGELDTTVNEVIAELGPWRAWTNTVAPLAGHKHQFVIATHRHVTDLHELNQDESLGLTTIIARIQLMFGFTGYATFTRSGSPLVNARSIAHLHVNLVVADGTTDIRPILGKSRKTVEMDQKVLHIFQRMYQMEMEGNINPYESLSAEEQVLVKDRL